MDKLINLTVFTSDFTSTKIPKSPFKDKTFEFETISCTFRESIDIMRENFILNRSYNFPKITRLRRSKSDLKVFLEKSMYIIVIDLDNIYSLYSRNKVIEILTEMDLYFVLGTSRSNNDIDNFNMKGIMLASGRNNRASVLGVLQELKSKLFRYCKVDLSAANDAAFQAPTLTGKEIAFNPGKYIPHSDLIEAPKIHVDTDGSSSHQKTVDICLEHFRQSGFQMSANDETKGIINFEHPSEKTKGGWFVYTNNPFIMHHFNPERSFSCFNDVKDRQAVQDFVEEYNAAKREIELRGSGNSNKSVVVNERYLTVSDKVKSIVTEWQEKKGLLKIKSAMGTGKSNILEYIIKDNISKGKPVLLITNRISVARDFKSKYKLKLYSDGDYNLGDSLIVQFDSLWRFSLKDFETIVMDEFMSILIHSRNTLGNYSNLNKVKLQYGLKTKSIVIADAFLYGAEDNFQTAKPKFSIINEYREDINLLKYPDLNSIIQKIVQSGVDAKRKKIKVSVSCTSKIMAQAIEKICLSAGLSTMVLSADTLEIDKEIIYEQFGLETHEAWDVFIYTPTLTVGVSNLNVCEDHFHIDESNTTDVISSIQMTRRSRKAKNIHYFLKQRRRFMTTDVEQLNNEINNNIQTYYTKNKNSLLISIDDDGDFALSDTGKFVNAVEIVFNTLENNHKHSFSILMSHQIKGSPIEQDECSVKIDINGIKSGIKEEEKNLLLKSLVSLEPVDYDLDILSEFKERNYIVSDKDKILKTMSKVQDHLKSSATQEQVRTITELEIASKFKFIQEMKRLKVFLTKNTHDIKSLISYIVSEDMVNKTQIEYFKYMSAVKQKDIKLKERFTANEIKEINSIIGFGNFRSFCSKLGYKKRGGVFYLSPDHSTLVRLLK